MLTAAMTPDLPRDDDLRHAPELAAMHLLHANLEVLEQALEAARKQQRCPRLPNPRITLVRSMRPLMSALSSLMLEYRRSLYRELTRYEPWDPDDEIPF